MTGLTPAALDDMSTVGVVCFAALLLVTALVRRWLIPGGQHREIVAIHRDTVAELRGRVQAQAGTIATQHDTISAQARALARFAESGDLAGRVLSSVRDIAAEGSAP